METIWILGATKGLGRQLTEVAAQRGFSVVVSSSHKTDCDQLAKYIQIKYNVSAHAFPFDLRTVKTVEEGQKCIEALYNKVKTINRVYFLAGSINPKDSSLQSINYLNALLDINFKGQIFLLNNLLNKAEVLQENLSITVASSISVLRARGDNLSYSTAKKSLEHYCKGYIHFLNRKAFKLHIIRFGYLDTSMSYGIKTLIRPSDPRKVAIKILRLSSKKSGIYYLPYFWRILGIAIRILPGKLFRVLSK